MRGRFVMAMMVLVLAIVGCCGCGSTQTPAEQIGTRVGMCALNCVLREVPAVVVNDAGEVVVVARDASVGAVE